jgi:hypothetical protein
MRNLLIVLALLGLSSSFASAAPNYKFYKFKCFYKTDFKHERCEAEGTFSTAEVLIEPGSIPAFPATLTVKCGSRSLTTTKAIDVSLLGDIFVEGIEGNIEAYLSIQDIGPNLLTGEFDEPFDSEVAFFEQGNPDDRFFGHCRVSKQ